MSLIHYAKENGTALAVINRPEMLNCFSYQTLLDLEQAVEEIRIDREIRTVIITGAGEKAFSAGADLKERKTLTDEQVRRNLLKMGEVLTKIEQLPQPVIAAINGFAFGGGLELALACDFRIMADHTQIGLTETGLGIIPGAGGTQRLPRLIGPSKALELIVKAKKINAEEALVYGLINEAVPSGQLMDTCKEWAAAISQNAPIAVTQAKFAVKNGMNTDLQTGLQIERKAYEVTIPTEDRLEALQAFSEKRKPEFKGK
ncbi:enoyl-CoA hydratase [Bacillus sp. FJAT-42376]|uniref:enoyl-CoA hydratase-related protein n=1 Tax=Bacillus sp. FJAT-42376 TaxID=2014076 RepID=UPI000F5166B6|nr:enoyl-CoA hydratase-related protein [Bacillus sp. FJAT-42376]AZB42260.1 enoyl-CoA hydratase [Bacillus sp. FJAT-42376]